MAENSNRYIETLAKYNTSVSDENIKRVVDEIINQKVAENNTQEVKEFLFNCIYHITSIFYLIRYSHYESSSKSILVSPGCNLSLLVLK